MADAPAPLLPPGGLFEVVFSFDTTGSMSRAIEEVKGRVQDMIQRLQADIPGIRIGVIAHGDYCDKDVFYLEKHVDLTNNVVELCELVKEVEGTGGGDPEECYELILKMVSGFDWTPGSQRALVMIGDATPHEPEYDLNTDNLDWRKEAENLGNMGIKIYGIQAFNNDDSTAFFEELVTLTSGQHLQLGEFSNVCDLIMAICYREKGPEFLHDYEAEVRAREKRMNRDMAGLFGALRRGDSNVSQGSAKSGGAGGLVKRASLVSRGSVASKPRSPAPSPVRMDDSDSDSDSGIAAVKPAKKAKKVRIAKPKTVKAGAAKVVAVPKVKKAKAAKKVDIAKARNKVNDSDFVLTKGNLKTRWSKWKLAISDTAPKSLKNWVQRSGPSAATKGKLGWRRKQLFPWEASNSRVMYEVAVQARPRGKIHVVYCKWSTLNAETSTWERRLLGQKNVKEEVESVLGQGCKVFVRRFETRRLGKNQKKTLSSFRKLYTYSWPEQRCIVKADGKTNRVVFK